jgi:hypothetical protein
MVSIVLVGVLAACGGGDGGSGGGVRVGAGFVRAPGTADAIDELDAATGDTVEVVLPVTAEGGTGNVRPNLQADVFIDGQDTTGVAFGVGAFAVERRSASRSELVLTLDGLLGASELDRYAAMLEDAGIDPADAGARVIEDRGGDGVLEVDVRVRGSVDTTDAGDTDVDDDVTFRIVESGAAPTGTTSAPVPATPSTSSTPPVDPTERRGSATIVDGEVMLTGPGGTQALIEVPAGFEVGGGGEAAASVYFTPPAGESGVPPTIYLSLQAARAPSFADEVDGYVEAAFGASSVQDGTRSNLEVDQQPATLAVGTGPNASVVVAVVDLGADVLELTLVGPKGESAANRRAVETLLDATTVTPS